MASFAAGVSIARLTLSVSHGDWLVVLYTNMRHVLLLVHCAWQDVTSVLAGTFCPITLRYCPQSNTAGGELTNCEEENLIRGRRMSP